MEIELQVENQVKELLQLPWSRELVPDDGVVFARVSELPGCVSEGSSLEEALRNLDDALYCWLSAAVEQGTQIPQPRGLVEDEDFSGRFSVRIPRSLHRKLAALAEREGASLNQTVTAILAEAVSIGSPAAPPSGDDAFEDIAAAAIRPISEGIGALKGIATFLRNRGSVNLACVLYGIAGERAAVLSGATAAAKELGTAGALARREHRMRLAEALWRESIRLDFTNIRSRSSLGQLLHHQGRYAEAIDLLEPVAAVDDYAKLFLGWSQLLLGRDRNDPQLMEPGLSNLVEALRKWCIYQGNRSQRGAWLRQVRRLRLLGAEYKEHVAQLVSFANSNANWGQVELSEVEAPASPEGEEADSVYEEK
jgi:antitoxin HicB